MDLYGTFVETAEKVKTSLKEKYNDQWTDPADTLGAKKKDSSDDE